jgi:RimJ/RimL family protein N-acetyltransferase
MPANIWEGKLVRLRAVELSDWETHYEWNKDTEAERAGYSIPFPTSREAVKRWAERAATNDQSTDEFHFQIETLAGELAGSINSHSCQPRHGTFAYGVMILEKHQRKGYASEGIILLLRYFFQERRYQKVNASVYSFNESSIRLHEDLGFQLEGRLRRMIYTRGQHYDELSYGMTVEEFAARHAGYWNETTE